jgi:starvation-inducible outer membrane lipoprotein
MNRMRTGSALVVLGVAFALAGCSTSPAIQRGAAQGAQMTVEGRRISSTRNGSRAR